MVTCASPSSIPTPDLPTNMGEVSNFSSSVSCVFTSRSYRGATWKTQFDTRGIDASNESSRKMSSSFSRGDNYGRVLNGLVSKKPIGTAKRSGPLVVQSRLFGPAMFESSKLRVLFLAKDDEKGKQQPRIYTLTHSDITAQITLTVAREINNSQLAGWYSRLQRDEVLAEWRKTKGEMSLHVHCHISGGDNFLHTLIAKLRFYIFQKELPVVLKAFMHGDVDLFRKHPELNVAQVWVYFHSSLQEYNRVECWGPLAEAIHRRPLKENDQQMLVEIAQMCLVPCDCCSRHATVIPIPKSFET